MIILNSLAVFPLYAIGNKVHRYAGWLAVFLFVFNPLNIASARSVREYAVLPLYFYLIFYLVQQLLEGGQTVITRWLLHATSVLLVIYTFVFDASSFFVLAILPITAVYVLLLIDKVLAVKKVWVRWGIATGILVGISLVGVMVYIGQPIIGTMLRKAKLGFAPLMLELITKSPVQHSYSFPPMGWVLMALACVPIFYWPWKDPNRRFLLILSGFYLFLLIFMSSVLGHRQFAVRERYQIILEMLSFLIWGTYIGKFVTWLKNKVSPVNSMWGRIGFLVIFLSLFTNLMGLQTIYDYKGGSGFVITGNNHFIGDEAYRFLLKHMEQGAVLISDRFHYNDEMNGYQLGNYEWVNYMFVLPKGNETLVEKMPPDTTGWVALYADVAKKNIKVFPQQTFDAGNIHFKFHGKFGDTYIWYWTRK